MSWLLKYYKGIYIVLVAVGVLCTYLSLWGTAVATGYFILVLASLVLGGRWLSRAVSRGVVEFYRDCDPEPLLENCDRLLAGAGDGRGGYLLALRCNRISALLALGRREEARAELDRFADAPPREKGSPAAVTLRWNRAELNLEEERLQGMEGELEAISAMARKVRVPSLFGGVTFPELMDWHVERGRCLLLLRTAGPVLELLPRLKELLNKAPCTLYQVQAIMDMAEYHLAWGETDQALSCLRLVAEKAPKLAMGARAKNKLSHMGF